MRVRRTIAAAWKWLDERSGLGAVWDVVGKHRVPKGSTWLYVFGTATLTALMIQIVSGVALATMYVPATGEAYASLQQISRPGTLSSIVRGMHYFGASAMVVLAVTHMIRVFLTGSFKFPRELGWASGVVLLLLTLGMAFTGQLLRWDQNAIWSVVVGADQAARTPIVGSALGDFIMGGRNLGGATLTRFYALHILVIPALILGGVSFHVYLVFRNGISEPARAGRPVRPGRYADVYARYVRWKGVPFWPFAAWRDVVFALLVVLTVVGLAVLAGAPSLGDPPDPTLINAEPRPDWYLLWYFAVLALLPPAWENVLIILMPAVGVGGLLLLPFVWPAGERSPRRRPWAVGSVFAGLAGLVALTVIGVRAPWSPRFDAPPLPDSVVASSDPQVQLGADLFHSRGCLYCHRVAGFGGERGPDLTFVGERLTEEQATLRILNGGTNMPSFAGIVAPSEISALVAFLQSRTRERSPD
jgi:ubiquinol-cytochrome c reductase cytochrome b subunit